MRGANSPGSELGSQNKWDVIYRRFSHITALASLSGGVFGLSLTITHYSVDAKPRDLLPVEPRFELHEVHQQGARDIDHEHASLRVGHCARDLLTDPLKRELSRDPRASLIQLKLERTCEGVDSLADETTVSAAQVDQPPHMIAQSVVSKALLKARWEFAMRDQDAGDMWRLSKLLVDQPMPDRVRERVRLSQAVGLLRDLERGPPSDLPPPLEDAYHELETLAQDAKGERVRARALETITRYSPSVRERARARSLLWHTLPQTPSASRFEAPPADPNWTTRGEAAFKARNYRLTLEAMRRASPLTPEVEREFFRDHPVEGLTQSPNIDLLNPSPKTQRAALLIAISLMRLRVHADEADKQLRRAISGSDRATKLSAIYYRAHLLGRLKRWDESISHFRRYLLEGPRGHRKREARYQIGRTLHQAGRYDEAIEAHRALLSRKPKDRAMYQWFLGWSYFRKGDCKGATRVWRKLERNKNLIVGPKALYWRARCSELQGDPRGALKTLKRLLNEAPLGYYSLLAVRLRAELSQKPVRWRNPLRASRARHWRAAAPRLPKREIKKLSAHRSSRALAQSARELLTMVSVGEEGLARVELRGLCRGEASRELKRRLGWRGLARLCDASEFYAGDHGKPWRKQASRRVAWLSGIHRRRPKERVGAYPLAYYQLSVAAAEAEEISPWWLMAHMLQESRYRPEVVSHAQAIGLMQILGRTGERIHARLKWPAGAFFSDQLYDPALSIRYAAWYLHHLSEDLGHPLLAVGAYNGGPMRFADHQDAFKGERFDVMVEELGAHESRNYLRKVTDHFVRYLALYASDAEWDHWTQQLSPPLYTPVPKRTVGF